MSYNTRNIFTSIIAITWFIAIIVGIIFTQSYGTPYTSEGLVTHFSLTPGAPYQAVLVNAAIILFTALILLLTVQKNNLIRNNAPATMLFFILFELTQPALITHVSASNISALAIGIATYLLYSSFQRNRAIEKSFLIALLFSAISLFNSRILFFLPIYALGMAQMQSSSLRTYASMIIGLVTPYWMIAGVNLITPIAIHYDSLQIASLPQFDLTELGSTIAIMIIGFFAGSHNLLFAINDNIQKRAKNGFINILSVYTALLMMIDSVHYIAYLPELIYCVSMQVSYLLATPQNNKVYNVIALVLTALLLAYHTWLYWI